MFPLCLPPLGTCHSLWQSSPPSFMFIGHAYKFFGYSIPIPFLTPPVYSVLTSLYFLIPAPFPPFALPIITPPNDLHTYDSVFVLFA